MLENKQIGTHFVVISKGIDVPLVNAIGSQVNAFRLLNYVSFCQTPTKYTLPAGHLVAIFLFTSSQLYYFLAF